jgi:DNA-binding PadR family transcriptional regulator
MDTVRLPNFAYVLLGLLTFEERSGYDLMRLIKRSIVYFYCDPASSQLYSELRRLLTHGLVTVREVHQTHRPNKRLYSVTPAGIATIQKWLGDTDLEPDSIKSPFLMKAFLGHLLSQATLVELFQARRRQLVYDLEESRKKTGNLLEKILEYPDQEEKFWFPLLPLQRCIALYEAEIAWIDEILGQLKQRQTKGRSGATGRRRMTQKAQKGDRT